MITSQAAAVLAAFRHLTSIVSVMSPDTLPGGDEQSGHRRRPARPAGRHAVDADAPTIRTRRVPIVAGVAAAFDDAKVAQLLATALALEGRASDRLATIFNTIAPDEDRKRRVLTMTRTMLSETDFGKSGQFQVLWTSAEELLISYNDAPFVSEQLSHGARRRRRAAPNGSRAAICRPSSPSGSRRSARTTSARCRSCC